MNKKTEREAIMSSMGEEADEKLVNVQKEIDSMEVKKPIKKLTCAKAAGVDGITAGMLNYGGETVVEWMFITLLGDREKYQMVEKGNYCAFP